MDIEGYLHFTNEASGAIRGLLFFASSALIPLGYLAVTKFRGRVWLPMLGLFVVQAVFLAFTNPAAHGEMMRVPIFLGNWLDIKAAPVGIAANVIFGVLYLMVLVQGVMAARAESDAAEGSATGTNRIVRLQTRLIQRGRWIGAAVLWIATLPVLAWGWELMWAKPSLVRDSLLSPWSGLPGDSPTSGLSPISEGFPYWEAYRAAILVGGCSTLAAGILVIARRKWAAVAGGLLAAAGGATAFVLAASLGYEFWHMYGHAVNDTCTGRWWGISRAAAVVLMAAGLSITMWPALKLFIRPPRRRDPPTPRVRSAGA